jgi:hypothetical protein
MHFFPSQENLGSLHIESWVCHHLEAKCFQTAYLKTLK